jgi:hypothetical protein
VVLMLNLEDLIEVRLAEPDDFLKVKETLSRIGVASKKEKTLYQSCHILHKQGKYYIIHFKQLFLLDNKSSDFSEEDRGRVNTIANLLSEWGLVILVDPAKSQNPITPLSQIKIISHREKTEWNLVTKYNIGKRKT